MKIQKKLFVVLLSFIMAGAWSQTSISANARKYVDSFMNLRMELTINKEKKDAVAQLNKYKSSNPYTSFTNQEKLVIESF